MRILVAGATGVIGNALVPQLTAAGHEVTGISRSTGRAGGLAAAGARSVVADLLDRAAVERAVREVAPQAVVHVATAIPAEINPKKLAEQFALTNRLRSEGARNLFAAAQQAGATRIVSEGLAYAYDPTSTEPADEDAPFWQHPPKPFVPVLAALKELESATQQSGGLVLRFGHLYGPGTIYAADGSFAQQVRGGKVPLVSGGSAVFSFTHVHDAATAIVAAVEGSATGALNIVDDEPARMGVWLPEFAKLLDAPKPKGAPAFMAKLFAGEWGVAFMSKLRGASNSQAKAALSWSPKYPTWRAGFAQELAT